MYNERIQCRRKERLKSSNNVDFMFATERANGRLSYIRVGYRNWAELFNQESVPTDLGRVSELLGSVTPGSQSRVILSQRRVFTMKSSRAFGVIKDIYHTVEC